MRVRALTPIVLILTMVTVAMGGKPQSVNVVTVSQSGIEGGGFQNVITKNPGTGVQFISGGDTSGFHTTSVNNGDVWVTSNTGLNDAFQDTITAIAFRQPPNATQVFAAFGVGNTGNSGNKPHLHLSAASCDPWARGTANCPTLPMNFRNTDANPRGLEQGRAYIAGTSRPPPDRSCPCSRGTLPERGPPTRWGRLPGPPASSWPSTSRAEPSPTSTRGPSGTA